MYILINTIAIFAIISWTISIQNKDKKGILIYQVFASALYSLEFFLLGGYSACLMNITSGLRCLIFYFEEKSVEKYQFGHRCYLHLLHYYLGLSHIMV